MSQFKIFRAALEILLGTACIFGGLQFHIYNPWPYLAGIALIVLGFWDVSKESKSGSLIKWDPTELDQFHKQFAKNIGLEE